MNERQFNKLIRWGVGLIAVGGWILSIRFSADGFGFQLPGFFLVGIFLGLMVTTLEVVLNKGIKSLTLRLGGILAYAYGWYTNFIGLSVAMGNPDFFSDPKQIAIPAVLGLFLEIVPEPLLLFALGIQGHDLIARLLEMTGKRSASPQGYPPNFPPPQFQTLAERHRHNAQQRRPQRQP